MSEIKMTEHNSQGTTDEINKNDSTVRGNFLLKYTILAPSFLNTQPWRFEARPNEIRIFGDLKRWRKVADMDQRELYISIGCALENMLIAAEHFGYGHQVSYLEGEQVAAVIKLNSGGKPSSFRDAELFKAIPEGVPFARSMRIGPCLLRRLNAWKNSALKKAFSYPIMPLGKSWDIGL
jgi:hypothetical protein